MSLDLLATHFLLQLKIPLAFWAANALCCPMSNFFSVHISKSFSTGLVIIHSFPRLSWYWGLSQPMCRTFHLTLFNYKAVHPLLKSVKIPPRHPSCIFIALNLGVIHMPAENTSNLTLYVIKKDNEQLWPRSLWDTIYHWSHSGHWDCNTFAYGHLVSTLSICQSIHQTHISPT